MKPSCIRTHKALDLQIINAEETCFHWPRNAKVLSDEIDRKSNNFSYIEQVQVNINTTSI